MAMLNNHMVYCFVDSNMAAPSLQVDVTDPDARVILEAVVQKLANASVDPQEKAGVAEPRGTGDWGDSCQELVDS